MQAPCGAAAVFVLRGFVVNLLRALIQTARRVSHFEDWYNTRQGIGRHGANHATRHRELTIGLAADPALDETRGMGARILPPLGGLGREADQGEGRGRTAADLRPPSSPRARP